MDNTGAREGQFVNALAPPDLAWAADISRLLAILFVRANPLALSGLSLI
jgi:hypothetical protein